MSHRSKLLKSTVQDFIAVHNEWVESGDARPSPDESYWDACDRIDEVFKSGDIPGDCRGLKIAADRFLDEWAAYNQRIDPENTYPRESFWHARQDLEAALVGAVDAPPLKPLEPMSVLREQKVSDMQIALIYGLRDRRGELMPQLVQVELDKPGSVLKTKGAVDGRDWKDPRIAEREREMAGVSGGSGDDADDENDAPTLADKTAAAERAKGKPCRETPKELWQQQVSVEQSALMLKQPIAAVARMFEEFEAEKVAGENDTPKPPTPGGTLASRQPAGAGAGK